MVDVQQTTYIAGLGTLAMNLSLRIVRMAQEVDADVFFAVALGNENRNEEGALEDELFELLDDRWIGPTVEQIRQSSGYHGDVEIAERRKEDWIPHLRQMVDMVCKEAWDRNLETPFGIEIFSFPSSGHYPLARWYFHELSERELDAVRLGITVLPHEDIKRRTLADSPNFIDEIAKLGLLDMVLVLDNRGPVARVHTFKYQDELVANGLNALSAAQVHSTTVSSAADVVIRLKSYANYLGMGFGVKGLIPLDQEPLPLPPAPPPPPLFPPTRHWWENTTRAVFGIKDGLPGPIVHFTGQYELRQEDNRYVWVWVPNVPAPLPPIFHLKDTIRQVVNAVEMALTDPQWRAIDIEGQVSTDVPVYMAISLPMQVDDPNWDEVIGAVETHFVGIPERHNLNWVWSPMNGSTIPLDPAKYRVQATAFFPMRTVKPLADIVTSEPLVRL